MTKSSLIIALGLTLVFCSAAAGQERFAGAAEYRNFTSSGGKVVQARLMRVVEGDAVLRSSATGNDTYVAISALSADDQAYIQGWDSGERSAQPAAPDEPAPVRPLIDPKLAQLLEPKGYKSAKLTQEGRAILVDVKIDGQPFVFAVDTGQTLTMMDSAVANQLDVRGEFELSSYTLADGSVEKVMAADVNSVEIGGVKISQISLGVASLKRIGFADTDGIFGSDILSYFGGVVDWTTLTLYLNSKDSD